MASRGSIRTLFQAPELVNEGEGFLLLVEGEPDAIAAHSCGLPTVAIPGASGWRREWRDRFAGRHVAIIADRDAPGEALALRVAGDLVSMTTEVRIVQLPVDGKPGYDLTDFLVEHDSPTNPAGAAAALDLLVASADAITAPLTGATRHQASTRRRIATVQGIGDGEVSALGRARLLGIVRLLESATEGRHKLLFWAATKASQLHAAGLVGECVAKEALRSAASTNGLLKDDGVRDVERTIRDGWRRGGAP